MKVQGTQFDFYFNMNFSNDFFKVFVFVVYMKFTFNWAAVLYLATLSLIEFCFHAA